MAGFMDRAEVLAAFCLPLCYFMSSKLEKLDNIINSIDNNDWEKRDSCYRFALMLTRDDINYFFKKNEYDDIIKDKAYSLFSY